MKKNQGFIGLVTVITVAAIAVLITSTVLLRSITESTISSDEEQSAKAWAAVNGCVEYGLLQLASTTGGWDSFPGDTSLDIGDFSCYILPIEETGAGTRTIRASSTVNDFVRKIEVVVSTNTPSLVIDSWTEVADFD